MLRLVADENFNGRILRGLLRRVPDLDIVRVQDLPIAGIDDPGLLAWAASEKRILLTHDVSTLTHYAYERVRRGDSMCGVVEINSDLPIGSVIEDLWLLIAASQPDELKDRVIFLPL